MEQRYNSKQNKGTQRQSGRRDRQKKEADWGIVRSRT